MKKPNGEEDWTFLISIDDGFVEYQYQLRPRFKRASIDKVYERIRKAFFVRKEAAMIRKETTKRT